MGYFSRQFTKKILARRLVFLLLFFVAGNFFAQNKNQTQTRNQTQNQPNIEPLFTTPDYTTYTADEIFELGLLYSECERGSQAWNNAWQKFEHIKQEVAAISKDAQTPEALGNTILKLLYAECLKEYSEKQTRLDVALETGLYNCVSSAVLYLAVAKLAGLDVRGQKTTQHAFCTVYVPTEQTNKLKKIDVETTNPYGFNPGSKQTFQREDELKGYYVVPKTYYSNRQEVSDAVFTGLIAGNVCSFYVEKNEYTNAVTLGAARYTAVINEKTKAAQDVRNEFDVLASNYVNIVPDNAAGFAPRLEWFCSFVDRWGMTSFLQENMDTAVSNMLVLCYQEGNEELAQAVGQKYKAYVSAKNVSTIEEMQWLYVLNNLMNSGDYENGYVAAVQAQDLLPKSTKIKNMKNAFYSNCITLVHNAFADSANCGQYEQARELLLEGLKKYPDDKTLKKDLSDLERFISRMNQ